MEAIKIGIVIHPIEKINTKKDSSFAMMLAAQKKNWEIYYIRPQDLYISDSKPHTSATRVSVTDTTNNWYQNQHTQDTPLNDFNVILMRKDPPFDMEYITTTYILEMAEQAGTLTLNKPASLRDANEKIFITQFPQCCTPLLISRNSTKHREFVAAHKDVILKP